MTEEKKLVKSMVWGLWDTIGMDWYDEPFFPNREEAQEYVDGIDWSWTREEGMAPPIVLASFREIDLSEEWS